MPWDRIGIGEPVWMKWSGGPISPRGKSVRWVASQLGHANPELTLRVYAHALSEEEQDLSFLDFGDTKRHPDGTSRVRDEEPRTRGRATPRRSGRTLEHETGLEPATTTLATWGSTN